MLFVHVLDYISIYSLTDKIFFFIKDPLAALQLIFGWGKYKNQSFKVRACVRAVAHVRAEFGVRRGAKPLWNCACEVRACWVFWAGRTRTGATALLKIFSQKTKREKWDKWEKSCPPGGIQIFGIKKSLVVFLVLFRRFSGFPGLNYYHIKMEVPKLKCLEVTQIIFCSFTARIWEIKLS